MGMSSIIMLCTTYTRVEPLSIDEAAWVASKQTIQSD